MLSTDKMPFDVSKLPGSAVDVYPSVDPDPVGVSRSPYTSNVTGLELVSAYQPDNH